MTPKILIANAMAWPTASRLAKAFHDVGCEVATLTPAEHPVRAAPYVSQRFSYDKRDPHPSVLAAIAGAEPDLIVPCDDRMVERLQWVWKHGPAAARAGVERSFGPVAACGEASSRLTLADLSRLPDVRTPPITPIDGYLDLLRAARNLGLPLILKLDGAWGGLHVVKVDRLAHLLPTLLRMRIKYSWPMRLKRAWMRGEIEALHDRPDRIVAQGFVSGRSANVALACWRGEIGAVVAIEAIETSARFGVSTVVRVLDDAAMLAVVRPIVERLQLSGLHGFDFILDDDGGAHLIEINNRATQTAHLPLGTGRDLAEALRAAIVGDKAREIRPPIHARDIALFPQEWTRDRTSPWLTRAHHDLPADDPAFVAYFGYAAPATQQVARDEALETVSEPG